MFPASTCAGKKPRPSSHENFVTSGLCRSGRDWPFGGRLASRWPSMAPPVTHLTLDWAAASAPRLFPLMKADLLVYPLAAETQPDFSGRYEPPLGWLARR